MVNDKTRYIIGLGTEGPTDSALFITDGDFRREFRIESAPWKMLSEFWTWYKSDRDNIPITLSTHRYGYLVMSLAEIILNWENKEDILSESIGGQ